MTNRFPSWCCECRSRIPAEQGTLIGKDETSGRWQVRCATCERVAAVVAEAKRKADAQAEAARRAAEAEKARAESADFYDRLRIGLRLHEFFATRTPHRPRCLAVLGLDPPVDAGTIKRRYRQLAKETHPDHGGDPSRFVEIRDAYDEALGLVEAGT